MKGSTDWRRAQLRRLTAFSASAGAILSVGRGREGT